MNTETWNKLYPVGTDVFVTEDNGEQCHSRTRSEAWTLGSGQAVVKLEGYSGGYDLARVQPVEPIKRHMIHQPFGELEKMPLHDVLDMMGSHGVAKIASTFSDQDDSPVFAVVLLSGPHIQDYLDAFDRIDDDGMQAATDVVAERRRQIEAEGWNAKHDDQNVRNELLWAAGCYTLHTAGLPSFVDLWPWAREWWKPTTPRRNLVKAAALIIAEIERLDRLEASHD